MPPPPPREPQMARWTRVWYCLGGGSVQRYDKEFFNWWAMITFCVNKYCYAGMDFNGDPDLPLPTDAQWGDIGMNSFFIFYVVFDVLHIYNVFGCASITNMHFCFGADVGPVRLEGKPRHMRRAKVPSAGESERVLHQVERCLDRLTTAIPPTEIEDLPVV